MTVFIEIATDSFDEVGSAQADALRSKYPHTVPGGTRVARRPLRGLELKEDRVAALKVIRADGTEIPLVNAGAPDGTGQKTDYTNYILQNVTEARMEKHQIVETFGESYIFFFGEAPRFIDVQIVVINSNDFNWEAEWWENYDRYFRGTRLVEMGARLYMFYDDNIVEGYMLNTQGVKVSDQPFMVQMSFRMFVTGHRNISFVGDPEFPIRASVVVSDIINRTSPDAITLRQSLRSKIADNKDEYIGTEAELANTQIVSSWDVPPAQLPTIRTEQEVQDLWLSAIQELAFFGADINDPRAFQNLSLMPIFGGVPNTGFGTVGIASGFSARAGIGAGVGATFTPAAGASYGTSVTNFNTTTSTTRVTSRQVDPLGAVFGTTTTTTTRITDRSFVQGGGDRGYGYFSGFATGPGFGRPGYGDYGGNGFGSGFGGAGDPGFVNPNAFTFEGVVDSNGTFARFNKPTRNSTVFGAGVTAGSVFPNRVGLGASNAGLTGSGAYVVPGRPTCFAMAAVGGDLIAVDGEPIFVESF